MHPCPCLPPAHPPPPHPIRVHLVASVRLLEVHIWFHLHLPLRLLEAVRLLEAGLGVHLEGFIRLRPTGVSMRRRPRAFVVGVSLRLCRPLTCLRLFLQNPFPQTSGSPHRSRGERHRQQQLQKQKP